MKLVAILGPVCFWLALTGSCPTLAGTEMWEPWQAHSYTLQPRESIQLEIGFERIQARSWRLVVDGNGIRCDLHALRLQDESLLYFKPHESRHEVDVPWGKGERLALVLTAGDHAGEFTVSLLGPPPASAPACYSYQVNRALEAYAVGRRLEAERLCEAALRADPEDGVARVMLAGFLQDRHFYERAAGMIDEALACELPADMEALALQLQVELKKLQAPLAARVRTGLAAAEEQLAAGENTAALQICEQLLADPSDLNADSRGRILEMRGQALHELGRHFEALDAFTQALTLYRSRAAQAVIYYRMGQLFLAMDNAAQAEGAFGIARKYGLPVGLDLQAEEALARIAQQKK
jgi:tetratricopeptide (TPR) repeat protein